VRHGRETLTAYFNTTASSVPLTAAPVLHQGFAQNELAPKGFVVAVN
jgi:cyclomaltodextrinase / maltogenic alpha-amylase / neopullulanase